MDSVTVRKITAKAKYFLQNYCEQLRTITDSVRKIFQNIQFYGHLRIRKNFFKIQNRNTDSVNVRRQKNYFCSLFTDIYGIRNKY